VYQDFISRKKIQVLLLENVFSRSGLNPHMDTEGPVVFLFASRTAVSLASRGCWRDTEGGGATCLPGFF
jgi:hypothetical protein